VATFLGTYPSLAEREPVVSIEDLLAQLTPPREFSGARFSNYLPDARFASQRDAVAACQDFTKGKSPKNATWMTPKAKGKPAGIYLDGGFGVGKTHLLAAIWHDFKGKKAFGSFLAYTGLIGVLGFANAVKQLSEYELICIDEFELDDPGDTMMLSRLLSELDAKGVKFAATSNTPPNALGQGRFAAADFAREIAAMSSRFVIATIDGEDYRHRPSEFTDSAFSDAEMVSWLEKQEEGGSQIACDDFGLLLKHLGSIHPSKYLNLLGDIESMALLNVTKLHDQVAALRWVSLVDRMYENQIAVRSTGVALTSTFSEEMIGGAYRKKYLRAVSRLGALSKN
jgi:cell division protein ZapE